MNDEKTKYLFETFPLLYSGHKESIQCNLMPFGFEHSDGWYDIIHNLSSKLEPLIEQWIKENPNWEQEHGSYSKAIQVKEKFGGLRFYMTFETDEMDKLISAAENESYKTCEWCGSKEDISQSSGWIVTLCKDCHKKRLDNRKKI